MAFDLDQLQSHCSELCLDAVRLSTDVLEVTLKADVVLEFRNFVDGSDTLIGFRDTPWHTHESLMLMVGKANYVELTECEIMTALKAGDVVIVEQFFKAKLHDRWIAHKIAPFDIRYIESDEEIRIHRLY